ncbi:hypothetical protein F2Q70_00033673 [Brassica cretica]|uniref:ACT domain-containing protein n=1 Tax=Brassica cretica TaxID=69181 RepID=A0A8S9JW35_BRACR|nr:hypothetical protein F2Q70_00033673 [Brassica cretica]
MMSEAAMERRERMKVEVFEEVILRLRQSDIIDTDLPGFVDDLWAHFNRLPARYALDVNVERAEDVVMHQRLLLSALDPHNRRPAIQVRLVQVQQPPPDSDSLTNETSSPPRRKRSIHPPPAFGSSPNLEALALAAHDNSVRNNSLYSRPLHEITFSTLDKPKLLLQLTALLAELGLNIQEAHVFSTTDGFSLDVFVVDGWPYEEVDRLRVALETEAAKIEVVKVADFGVARVKAQTGVMTAETGTYRWMAPELPYEYMTPLQAAVGVVQKGLRPKIPKKTHPKMRELMERLWEKDPSLRPDFAEIKEQLEEIANEVGEEGEEKKKASRGGGGIFAALRRSATTHH